MKNLYFTIGLPRSGKSTFASKWLYNEIDISNGIALPVITCRCKNNVAPRVIVRADDIRLSMGHRWNGYVEDFVHATKLLMIRALLKEHDVLVDGTHTTRNSIQSLLQIDVHSQPLLVLTPPDVCKQRAIATNQEDLVPVIDRMATQLDGLGTGDKLYTTNILNKIDSWRLEVSQPRISD